jgi:hypothetical protein
VNNVARTVARKGGGKPADRKCPGDWFCASLIHR